MWFDYTSFNVKRSRLSEPVHCSSVWVWFLLRCWKFEYWDSRWILLMINYFIMNATRWIYASEYFKSSVELYFVFMHCMVHWYMVNVPIIIIVSYPETPVFFFCCCRKWIRMDLNWVMWPLLIRLLFTAYSLCFRKLFYLIKDIIGLHIENFNELFDAIRCSCTVHQSSSSVGNVFAPDNNSFVFCAKRPLFRTRWRGMINYGIIMGIRE